MGTSYRYWCNFKTFLHPLFSIMAASTDRSPMHNTGVISIYMFLLTQQLCCFLWQEAWFNCHAQARRCCLMLCVLAWPMHGSWRISVCCVWTAEKCYPLQVALNAAKATSEKVQQQADELLAEKNRKELEAADMRRQCTDLQQRASTLSVNISFWPLRSLQIASPLSGRPPSILAFWTSFRSCKSCASSVNRNASITQTLETHRVT